MFDVKVQKVWIWQETQDCLWNIAKENYGNPFLWPRIYEANREQIRNPNVIFPKQQIVIPPLDEVGTPVTSMEPTFIPDLSSEGTSSPVSVDVLPPAAPAPSKSTGKKKKSNTAAPIMEETRWNEMRSFSRW
jgi:hypothetical protein